MVKRMNGEWEIIEGARIFPAWSEIVIGYNPENEITPYVTWETNNGFDFYYGHYCKNRNDAKIDLLERLENQIAIYKSFFKNNESEEN